MKPWRDYEYIMLRGDEPTPSEVQPPFKSRYARKIFKRVQVFDNIYVDP